MAVLTDDFEQQVYRSVTEEEKVSQGWRSNSVCPCEACVIPAAQARLQFSGFWLIRHCSVTVLHPRLSKAIAKLTCVLEQRQPAEPLAAQEYTTHLQQ